MFDGHPHRANNLVVFRYGTFSVLFKIVVLGIEFRIYSHLLLKQNKICDSKKSLTAAIKSCTIKDFVTQLDSSNRRSHRKRYGSV